MQQSNQVERKCGLVAQEGTGEKNISVGVCFPQMEHPGQRKWDDAAGQAHQAEGGKRQAGGSLGLD